MNKRSKAARSSHPNAGPSQLKWFYFVLAGAAVAGVVAVWTSLGGKRGEVAAAPVELGDVEDQELVDLAQGVVYGDPDAPVTIMEFGDYQCPACGQFAQLVKPRVDLAYIETGQAKLVFHDFPLSTHPHSFVAARAARCAGDQDRYFEYHDAIFATQRRWSPMRDATGHFVDLAEETGLDVGAFRGCLESDRHADVVSANLRLGQLLGVGGTPTVFVHYGSGPAQRLGGFQFLDIQRAMEAGDAS